MRDVPGRLELLADEAGEPVVAVKYVVASAVAGVELENRCFEGIEVLEKGFGRQRLARAGR